MCDQDKDIKRLLGSANMQAAPDPARMQTVQERMLGIANSSNTFHRPRYRTVWMVALLLLTVSAVGFAATQTGRDLIRWIFTPVETTHHVTWSAPDGDSTYSMGGNIPESYSPEEADAIKAQFAEIHQIKQGGGGRLVGLLEGPEITVYQIEYTLASGETITAGDKPSGQQAMNMHSDEIMLLRDAGEGELIQQEDFLIGLGRFTIRFTLSDGQTVELVTFYPPGTRQERETIFAETRQLKQQRRFSVLNASAQPDGKVYGVLRYTLADGRVVGVSEQVPSEVVTPDGQNVAMPETETSEREKPTLNNEIPDEVRELMQAGGGRLVYLMETPHYSGHGMSRVYRVEYTLNNGETMTVGTSQLTRAQKANMRIDEILELHDAGKGEIIAEEQSERGLGLFTIRYTFSDGQHADLKTNYPPSTRDERQAIFDEASKLKKDLSFSVHEPVRSPYGPVVATLRYTLSDGRTVGVLEQVPTGLISADGKYVVMPGTNETVEIKKLGGDE